jgi:hypothetical protein
MKLQTFTMIMCTTALIATAAQPEAPTSPLSLYSGGAAVGVLKSLTTSLKAESKSFIKFSFISDVYLSDRAHLFIDADWLSPRKNFGMDAGADFLILQGRFRPFLGAGVGIRYFGKNGYSFGDNFGPSATIHAGMLVELSKTVQLRIRAPFQVVLNEKRDAGAGLDVGLLFSKPYRHVKKFDYD